jgi:hypothetical protein
VTKSSVSLRDWALAGDQIAGAGTAAPADNAVIDLRKSRRFIEASQGWRVVRCWKPPQAACQAMCRHCRRAKCAFQRLRRRKFIIAEMLAGRPEQLPHIY